MPLELTTAPHFPSSPSAPAHGGVGVVVTTVDARHYQRVVAWQAAMDLVAACYRLTRRLPVSERAGLCAAVHAATTAVASRIAVAVGPVPDDVDARSARRRATADARAALRESETLLALMLRVGYLTAEELEPALHLAARVESELDRGTR